MALNNSMNLQEQLDMILQRAAEAGVESNYFFVTTLKRYQVQLKLLSDLEAIIRSEDSLLVTKTYVKNRENVCTHPAIKEYNTTSTAANQTVQTLLKIIKSMSEDSGPGQRGTGGGTMNELQAFLEGRA